MKYHLSVLIPSRNEYYHDIDLLYETVTNVLANTSPRTEIIAVLDGYWPKQPLPVNSRLTVIHHNQSIGQRAATNEAARVAQGEWVCKLDAHCAVGPDFDTRLLQDAQPHWTIVPGQFNLQVFEWKCKKCSWTKDQSPKPLKCEKCGSRYLKQVKIWKPRDGQEGRRRAYTHSWRFDSNLDFQYWGGFTSDEKYCKKNGIPFRPEAQGQIHDTMSLLGACWAMRRERYYEIQPCEESFGSWGDMGTEISCKTWLSRGELKVNQNTWFAHFFRVGGLGFPYPDGGRKERAKARGKELWLKNLWPKQVYPLAWLIDRFAPVPDWNDDNPVTQQVKAAGEEFYRQPGQMTQAAAVVVKKPRKLALYYTCNSHDGMLELAARNNLKHATNGHEVGCVALQRTDFGDWSIVLDRQKSGGTMHYQILAGLERSTADYVFLCESDVLYHPSHFEFTPPDNDTFYYNVNVWRVRYSDGHAVRTAGLQQVSGICASRQLLLAHYRKRVELIEQNGGVFDTKRMAYEPGTRGKFGDERVANWESKYPNLDITGHGQTLTVPHFSIDSFRNKKYAEGWQETDEALPGWPKIAGRVQEWLKELASG
jgi:DNA-directed RNA polymerase subunit RPC12/RpoP